jgi:GTP1/Obg family GTP-binding protein
MIYFIDPTQEASCNLEEQIHLLRDIREFYPTFIFLIAITKIDLVDQVTIDDIETKITSADIGVEKLFRISSTTDDGIDLLFQYLEKTIKDRVLRSRKFRALTTPQIAEDQLTLELEQDEDEYYY